MTSWEGSGGNEAMVPAYQLETRVAKLISRESLLLSLIAGFYPSCAENPAVQGGDVERGERSSPKLNSVSAAARCTGG